MIREYKMKMIDYLKNHKHNQKNSIIEVGEVNIKLNIQYQAKKNNQLILNKK